ncbi:YbaN family protein [Asticcacaulis machinosus]|uniref:YbaN family protein n=1 Tax=Asticcacaulis machinosus TaxID=2984211 RepID=A0ABT5HJA3_9CAUL|nr:YbaN family protein [Asticcacaulis machinosus]MDC7676073.1 YbaN family protein [Asticcacaulis machinosus]
MPARLIWCVAGLVMVGLGIVGAFLPLMPSTIFLIVAVWCFGKSSPRLEAWLLNHPRFGPTLRNWNDRKAISRPAKVMALGGMAVGYGLFYWGARPNIFLAAGVLVAIAACAIYVATRPE